MYLHLYVLYIPFFLPFVTYFFLILLFKAFIPSKTIFFVEEHNNHEYYIKGLRNNDQAIMHKIYQEFQASFRSWVLNNSGTDLDAEDTFQEALIAIYIKANHDDFLLESSFGAYFFGVAKNLWRKKLIKKKRAQKVRNTLFQEQVSEVKRNNVFDESLQNDIWIKSMLDTFSLLSPRCQNLLDLLFIKNTPIKEVEKLLKTNANAIYVRKHKCLNRWRNLIKEKTDSNK